MIPISNLLYYFTYQSYHWLEEIYSAVVYLYITLIYKIYYKCIIIYYYFGETENMDFYVLKSINLLYLHNIIPRYLK